MKINSKEIRIRFDALARRHLVDWDKRNPEPSKPDPEVIRKELLARKFTVDVEPLKIAFRENWDHEPGLFEIVMPPAWAAYLKAVSDHSDARDRFEKELTEAKEDFLDRVLFDFESGYVHLTNFRKWKDSTQKADEPFDGR